MRRCKWLIALTCKPLVSLIHVGETWYQLSKLCHPTAQSPLMDPSIENDLSECPKAWPNLRGWIPAGDLCKHFWPNVPIFRSRFLNDIFKNRWMARFFVLSKWEDVCHFCVLKQVLILQNKPLVSFLTKQTREANSSTLIFVSPWFPELLMFELLSSNAVSD